MYKNQKIKMPQIVIFLAISLIMNAMGNGLTVACNMGSAVWTASAANIASDFSFPIGRVLFFYGLLQIVVNALLLQKIEPKRIFGNMIFLLFFSSFVGIFTNAFSSMGVPHVAIPIRIVLDLIGVVMIAIAISIYQRVNVIMHPGDEMTSIIRFKYVNGNPKIAQWLNFSIPAAIILLLMLVTGNLVAVNIGTIVSLLITGSVIGFADKYIFSDLSHDLEKVKA
jgi:uncharacterized membrane protein YczE